MNSAQVELIKRSFARIMPRKREAMRVFYDELFRLDPDLRRLFKTDIEDQGTKFMAMVATAVLAAGDGIDRDDALAALGDRHRDYGVPVDKLTLATEALMVAFRSVLGTRFDADTEFAWRGWCATIVAAMNKQ